ncbi:Hypothetical predicted protein, partial [Mytilus galloprovincialis]
TVKRKYGICPTFTDKPLSFCMVAFVISNCGGNDADCSGTKKCCPNICGSRQCKEPTTKPRPECPSTTSQNKAAACHTHQCSHDKECTQGKICCDVICGIGCTEPVKPNPPKPRPGVCPSFPNVKDPNSCVLDCDVDSDCTDRNKKCCDTPCGGRTCTKPSTGDRPGCPACSNSQSGPGCPVCIQYQQLCNSDNECNRDQLCCYNPSCGTSCKRIYAR